MKCTTKLNCDRDQTSKFKLARFIYYYTIVCIYIYIVFSYYIKNYINIITKIIKSNWKNSTIQKLINLKIYILKYV